MLQQNPYPSFMLLSFMDIWVKTTTTTFMKYYHIHFYYTLHRPIFLLVFKFGINISFHMKATTLSHLYLCLFIQMSSDHTYQDIITSNIISLEKLSNFLIQQVKLIFLNICCVFCIVNDQWEWNCRLNFFPHNITNHSTNSSWSYVQYPTTTTISWGSWLLSTQKWYVSLM